MQKVSYEYNKIFQKQPPDVFCKKRRSEKFRNFQRKIPVLKSLFNEVAGPQVFFFSQVDFFPVNNAKLLKTPILRNIGQRLLLFIFIIFFFLLFLFFGFSQGGPLNKSRRSFSTYRHFKRAFIKNYRRKNFWR